MTSNHHQRAKASAIGVAAARTAGTPTPEWITFLTFTGYIVIVLPLYLRPVKPVEATTRPAEQTAARA